MAVQDTGTGIPRDKLESIFEMFTQVDGGSRQEAQGGLGIGLTLVKRLVQMHGGQVEAYSAGLGNRQPVRRSLAGAGGGIPA